MALRAGVDSQAGRIFYQANNPDVIPFLQTGYDVQWTGPDQQIESPTHLPPIMSGCGWRSTGCALTPA